MPFRRSTPREIPRRPRAFRLAAATLAGLALVVGGGASAAGGSPRPDSAAFDWPELHQNAGLDGYASNSTLSTATASGLGIAWSTNLYGAALDSPVVAYDATLGESLAYVGTDNGYFYAVDADNGQVVWSDWLGAPIRGTPAVSGGSVFVGTAVTPRFFSLNATTGSVNCSIPEPTSLESSPVVATPPGGVATVYLADEDSGSTTGPVVAVNAASCAVEWQFTGYAQESGPWDPISYAIDATREPLVLFGTADPDSGVYAVDAITGQEVWRFQVTNPAPGVYDVGAGVVVSPPGTNGFADGVAYVPTKFGILYALDLTTGAQMWSYTFNTEPADGETGISTPALDGTNLVFGGARGVDDVDAVTGQLLWATSTPAEVTSSPAIAGPAGAEVVAFADLTGTVRVLSLATGSQAYGYHTAGYVTGSPAVSDGNLLIASSDGFLYDFAAGGGSETSAPSAIISSPPDLSVLPNPNGSLAITGTAVDATGLVGVDVAVQESGPAGPWFDAATGTWAPGPTSNAASLGSPGATSSTWSFGLPVPKAGGAYRIVVNAVSTTGRPDVSPAQAEFSVTYSTKGPHFELSASFAAPGATLTAKGGSFAHGEIVAITLLGATLATVTASTATGSFSNVKVRIPASSSFGEVAVVATGEHSGHSASAALYVTNAWAELGDGPARLGSEQNDTVLADLVHPGGNIFVDPAWSVVTASPASTAPAISDAVAYVGDSGGHVIAVDTHNGALLWTWTAPAGAAITGSPAIDSTTGLVLVGAADGNLYALSASKGTQAWSAPLGGAVAAPAFSAGTVYASSAGGTVEALSERTGAVAWSVNLGSAASAAAVDTSKKTVVVGDAAGGLVALSSTSGAQLWLFAAGSGIVAPPLVSGGSVYTSTTAGVVEAVSEATGSPSWSTGTSGAITATAVLSGQWLIVGTASGTVEWLAASTGAMRLSDQAGGAVVGIGATVGVVVVELSTGVIKAYRTAGGNFIWSQTVSQSLATSPVVVNGTIYVGGGTAGLLAFTPYGGPPA